MWWSGFGCHRRLVYQLEYYGKRKQRVQYADADIYGVDAAVLSCVAKCLKVYGPNMTNYERSPQCSRVSTCGGKGLAATGGLLVN